MARMPGANWLGEHSPRRAMSRYDIVCIHTIVGHAPAHAAHFSTHDNGRIDQSRDTKYRSAANLDGNYRVIAIENEDGAKDVPLTDEQVDACAKILAWAHKTHGVPLQLAPDSKPGSRGLAYHRQGVDGNFSGYAYPGRVPGGEKWSTAFGKTCPRDKRIAQLPEILRRAKLIAYPPTPKPSAPAQGDINRRVIESLTRIEACLRVLMTPEQERAAAESANQTNQARKWNIVTNQDNINKRVIESLTRIEACFRVVMTAEQEKAAADAAARTNESRKW